jgi:hypothetical protein
MEKEVLSTLYQQLISEVLNNFLIWQTAKTKGVLLSILTRAGLAYQAGSAYKDPL